MGRGIACGSFCVRRPPAAHLGGPAGALNRSSGYMKRLRRSSGYMRGGAETKYFYSTKRRPKPDIQRQRQAGSTQRPAPCCLATSARSCFIGVMIANARSKEPRRAVGSARLRCTSRRCGAAGWHPAAAASRQHACSGFKPRRRTGAVQSCCCMSR